MKQVSVGEAGGRKYPEWIALVVTADAEGRPNAMAAGWCMWTSGSPPMMAVSVGLTRYTHELLEARGEFVLAFPGVGQGEATLAVGSQSGRDVPDKVATAGLAVEPATQVGVPLIKGATANFECRLACQLRTGDHTIFVGEVWPPTLPTPPSNASSTSARVTPPHCRKRRRPSRCSARAPPPCLPAVLVSGTPLDPPAWPSHPPDCGARGHEKVLFASPKASR